MSTPNNTPKNRTKTNSKRPSTYSYYAAGISWVGSMFPPAPRDPRIYGPSDPLDAMPSGPFDDEDGDESWRKSHHGTHVYTGEAVIKTSRPPTAEQKRLRDQFWADQEAKQNQSVATEAESQGQIRPSADEPLHFPDVLPTFSGPVPAPELDLDVFEGQVVMQSPVIAAASSVHDSSVDGEYELDDDLPDAHQEQPIGSEANNGDQVPDSTPSELSSPISVDDWDDDDLLSLWKYKAIRKKGYEPMLAVFQGQTVESLHEAWTKHKQRCRQLGDAWEAARKPKGPVSDWFVE